MQAEGISGRCASDDDAELSLWLTTDRILQRLNRQFRHINKPTDVLSFPQVEAKGERRKAKGETDNSSALRPSSFALHLGDVVISLPTAQRQAEEQGWSLEEEVEWLTVHGVLHLLGYNDETKRERERMLWRQERILKDLRGRE